MRDLSATTDLDELRSSDPVNEQVRDGHDLSAPQLTHLAEVHDHQCLPPGSGGAGHMVVLPGEPPPLTHAHRPSGETPVDGAAR